MDKYEDNAVTRDRLSLPGAFTLLAVAALTIMVGCVIVPGLPDAAAQLHVTLDAGWLVTLPALGVVLFAPLTARLMEAIGLKAALLVGLFFYGLFGVGGALLSGNAWVCVDRLLLGGATALVMSSGTGLLSAFYTGEARMAMIARQGMSIELSGVLFLALGGLLAGLNWRYPFALYLLAWLLLPLAALTIPGMPAKPATTAPTAARQQLPSAVVAAYLAATLSMTLFFTGVIVLPGRLASLAFTPAETGYFLSFVSLVAVAGAAALPRVARTLGERLTLAVAMFGYAVAHLVFALASTTPPLLGGGILLGVGFGLSIPLVNHLTVEYSSEAARSRNLAYLAMALFAGQFLSSFMQYIPGNTSTLFLAAAALAAILGLAFIITARPRVST